MPDLHAAVAEIPRTTAWNDYWSILRSMPSGSHLRSVPTKSLAQLDSLREVPSLSRIRVLRNFSIEPLLPWLRWGGYQRGVRIEVELADLGLLQQELLEPSSSVSSGQLDAIVLALWLEGIDGIFDATHGFCCDRGWELLRELALLATERFATPVIVNTFLPPRGIVHGSRAITDVHRLNEQIRSLVADQSNLMLVDVPRLAERIGWDAARDERLWQLYQAPLTGAMLTAWGSELAQILAAACGRVRKVLVLDCDETLWGGIVGEEGIAGIRLDPNLHPGSVYHTFQRQVLELQRQGVLIALCSKNNEADVFSVLQRHPHCLLRPEHLVAWRVNWRDKVDNLCALAAELNLGLDQFVFVDDSPVECEHVRQALPQVDVLQLASDASNLTQLLLDYNGFVSPVQTATDRNRTASYQAERERAATRSTAASLEAFLESLSLQAAITPASVLELPRIHQLVSRTNQFNLTTRRYSSTELRKILESPEALMLAMEATDRFGDYGLTGLAIAMWNAEARAIVIDTFLMSCRVLGRRLEQALLFELVRKIEERWPNYPIHAAYRPTAKNGQVVDFLDRHGFQRRGQTDDSVQYELVPERRPAAPRNVFILAMKG